MTQRLCPFCGKEFSSGASYRVHKSRYHHGEQELEEQNVAKNETCEKESPEHNEIEPTEEGSESDWIWLVGLGGLALLIMLIFSGHGGDQQ